MKMRNSILTLALALATFTLFAGTPKQPVLMTVDGKPVTVEEFNYLYQKNNQQQAEPQSLEDYLDMFVVYKLKVADAEHAGIQDTPEFKREFEGYRRDLAQPYLIDTNAKERLVDEFYGRLGEEIKVSHIMMNKKFGAAEGAAERHTLDSLRTAIIEGKADFGDVATQYSIDPAAKQNHGDLGWMSAGRYPYSFENVAYDTPVGEISQVFDTPFGIHILKVEGRRPARGELHARHILKMTRGLSPEEQEQKKQQIDSIYQALKDGADFADLARRFSDDPGSAANGGDLSWFGPGRMVPEFEETAYSLNDGEFSAPFQTQFGWHIVDRIESRGLPPFDQLKKSIEQFIDRDDRQATAIQAKTRQLRQKFEIATVHPAIDEITAQINAAGKLDSALIATLRADNRTLVTSNVAGQSRTVADVFAVLPPHITKQTADQANGTILNRLDDVMDELATDAERQSLLADNEDYRNLLNEYRDGMLLFEISDRNVWKKAKDDTDGLRNYFLTHKADYATWPAPKFKGLVIFTTSDSLENEIKTFLAGNPLERIDVNGVLNAKYGKNVKVERVIAAKGDNAIIDYLAFGGEKASPSGRWTNCFTYLGETIDQPVEVDDVKGAVTTDYQNHLEQEWIKQLRKKYKVKINKKTLKELQQ